MKIYSSKKDGIKIIEYKVKKKKEMKKNARDGESN
jgi:hypothetical protein